MSLNVNDIANGRYRVHYVCKGNEKLVYKIIRLLEDGRDETEDAWNAFAKISRMKKKDLQMLKIQALLS